MALIPQAEGMAPQGEPPAQEPAQNMQEGAQGQEDFSPEQDDVYQRAQIAVGRLLYEADGITDAIEQISESGSVAEGLKRTVQGVLTAIDERTGGQIDEEVMVALALDVLTQLVEAMEARGTNVRGRDIAQAVQMLASEYLEQGGVDTATLQQALSQMDFDAIGLAIDKGLSGGKKGGADPQREDGDSEDSEAGEGEEFEDDKQERGE